MGCLAVSVGMGRCFKQQIPHPLKKRGFGMTVQSRVGANGIDPAAKRFYRILILGRGVLR
jgi:hypothetical protein